jgi:hypothetical protein
LDAIGRLVRLSNHAELLKPLPLAPEKKRQYKKKKEPTEEVLNKQKVKYEQDKEKNERQSAFWEDILVGFFFFFPS